MAGHPGAGRLRRAAPAAWVLPAAAAWIGGQPGLAVLSAWCCLCLHAAPRAVRRLGATPRAALLTFGLATAALLWAARSGLLDPLAPEPTPAEAAAARSRSETARSIARALAEGEAAWRSRHRKGGQPPGREAP